MAKGYWIAHNPVKDVEVYGAYKIAAAPALRAYGAQFLVNQKAAFILTESVSSKISSDKSSMFL